MEVPAGGRLDFFGFAWEKSLSVIKRWKSRLNECQLSQNCGSRFYEGA